VSSIGTTHGRCVEARNVALMNALRSAVAHVRGSGFRLEDLIFVGTALGLHLSASWSAGNRRRVSDEALK
jgi:hypothetical protein